MGYQSDGAVWYDQDDAWTAQLANLAGHAQELPLFQEPGCKSPLVAPLGSGKRTSGEPANLSDAVALCAPPVPGRDLPTRSVAIAGALTQDAIYSTPQTVTGPLQQQVYRQVLPTNGTQLRAGLRHKPTLVSVEFGANEVLGARSGIAIPGVTIFPFASWAFLYNALVDTVGMNAPRVLLVGLINDAADFPSFRTGAEIHADSLTMNVAFNVDVLSDCAGSPNLVFVPVRVPTAIATGLARRAAGLTPFSFSCADGGTGVQDYVLTPAEAAVVNGTLASMNAHIRALASARGYAHFELEVLYGMPGLKPPFSSVALMTSMQPYGSYISLDGIHPNAAGHAILARAAARALNHTYKLRIPDPVSFVASR